MRSYGVTNFIEVLPTGIDVKQFNRLPKSCVIIKELSQTYGYDDQNTVLLSLGRISQEKSIDFLIEAMPYLIRANENLRLLIVGDGPYRKDLENLVQSLQMEKYVCFAGRIPFCEVINYYSLADFFINASKTETQGLTIFEAMASNLPVIVYDDDNIADVVINGESGRLFTDQESYLKAVLEAISSPEETHQMSENAKAVIDSLSKEAFGIRMSEIYQKIISQKRDVEEEMDWMFLE